MEKIIQEIESGLVTSNRLVNKARYELQQYNNELEALKKLQIAAQNCKDEKFIQSKKIINREEQQCISVLKELLPDKDIFTQTSVSALINIPNKFRDEYAGLRQYYDKLYVDFVICDCYKPIAVVEYQGSGHYGKKYLYDNIKRGIELRDFIKRCIFEMANIPLLVVDIGNFMKDQSFNANMDSFIKLNQNKNSKKSVCNDDYSKVAKDYYEGLTIQIRDYLKNELSNLNLN